MKVTDFLTKEDIDYIKEVALLFKGQYLIFNEIKFVIPLEKWEFENINKVV